MDVRGYEGLYQVSNLGRVRSLDRFVDHDSFGVQTKRLVRGRNLSLVENAQGYLQVSLSKDANYKIMKVHRLVALSFVEGYGPELIVCHNDGDKSNNIASNLRWDTFSSNSIDIIKHGSNWQSKKEKCPRGHWLVEPNLKSRSKLGFDGHRTCLACDKANNARSMNENIQKYSLDLVANVYYEKIMNGTLPKRFGIAKYLQENFKTDGSYEAK